MSGVKGFDVSGIEDVQKLLREKVPDKANAIMRTTIHGIAAEITKKAKQNVQVKTGTLKKSIKTRRRKSRPDNPISEVYITHGKGVKNDGFYWRFVEYGTGGGRGSHLAGMFQGDAQPFMTPAREDVFSNIDQILETVFLKKLEQATKRELKKQAARNKKK